MFAIIAQDERRGLGFGKKKVKRKNEGSRIKLGEIKDKLTQGGWQRNGSNESTALHFWIPGKKSRVVGKREISQGDRRTGCGTSHKVKK